MFQEASRIAEELGDLANWAQNLNLQATVQFQLGEQELAVVNYQKSCALFEEAKNTGMLIECLYDLGSALRETGKNSDAFKAFKKASDLATAHNRVIMLIRSLSQLASLMMVQGDQDEAQEYLKVARSSIKDMPESSIPLEYDITRARLFIRQGKLKQADMLLRQKASKSFAGSLDSASFHLAMAELSHSQRVAEKRGRDPVPHYEKAMAEFESNKYHGSYVYTRRHYAEHLIASNADPVRGREILDDLSDL